MRLNEHLEHPKGHVMFFPRLQAARRGDRLEAAWIVLPVRPLARLAQFKNSAAPAVKEEDRGR